MYSLCVFVGRLSSTALKVKCYYAHHMILLLPARMPIGYQKLSQALLGNTVAQLLIGPKGCVLGSYTRKKRNTSEYRKYLHHLPFTFDDIVRLLKPPPMDEQFIVVSTNKKMVNT